MAGEISWTEFRYASVMCSLIECMVCLLVVTLFDVRPSSDDDDSAVGDGKDACDKDDADGELGLRPSSIFNRSCGIPGGG